MAGRKKVALVIGATGMVGRHLVELLGQSDYYRGVTALVRREAGLQGGKVREKMIDFDNMAAQKEIHQADEAFCCLGTTMKKAGSKEAFYQVDFTYVVNFAKACQAAGIKSFYLVTAVGANPNSSFYYNRVKGEVEAAVTAIPFERCFIFRPSLLLGKRNEKRTGESMAQAFDQYFSWALPPRYKGIASEDVARAMVTAAQWNRKGNAIFQSEDIREIATPEK